MPQLGPILPTPDVTARLGLPPGPDYTQPEWQQGLLELRDKTAAQQTAYQKALTALHVTLNDVDPAMAETHQRRFLQESGGDVSKAQAAAASQGYRLSPESWNPVVTQMHEEAARQQIQADPTNATNAPTGWGQNFLANVRAAHQSGVTANQVALMHGLSAIQPLKPGETPEQHHAKLWQGTQGFLEQQADAERMNNPHNPEGFVATAGQFLGSLPTGISPLTYIGGGYGQGATEVASNPEMTPEQKTKYASAGALINAAQLAAFGPAFEAAGAAAPTEAGVLNAASRVGAKSVAGGTVFAGGSVAKDALMGKPLDAGEAAKAYLTGSTLAGGHEVVAGGHTPTPTETPGEIGPQRPWQTPEELAGQPEAEAPKPKPAPELRKSIQKLGERLDAVDYNKIPEATPGEHAPLPEELTNEDLHTFLTPQEEGGPASFRGGPRVKEAAERLAAHEHQPDRTGTQGPPGDEERRFDELAKGYTFQKPEEVNPRGIAAMNREKFAGPNALQSAAGNQAVREEYGEAPKAPEENSYNPRQAYRDMSQADRLAARANEPVPEARPNPLQQAAEARLPFDYPYEAPNPLQQAAEARLPFDYPYEAPKPAPTPEVQPVEQPDALAAAREAQAEAPKAEAPEGETVFQRIAREGAEKAEALASEEHGGEKYTEAFLNRSVKPTVEKAAQAFTDFGTALDRNLGTGLTHTEAGNEARAAILAAKGRAVQQGHAFEAAMVNTGAREKAPSFSKDEATALQAWDNIHNGAYAPTKEENAALDLIQQTRKVNFARAQKLGLPFKDMEGEGLSRVFEPDPEAANAPGKAGSRSLAGAEKFFKSQTFDLPSDAYRAAKAAGLKPAYDNIYDMQAAVQYAVEDSLNQRENIRAADKGGTLAWVKKGDKPPLGLDTPIEDKIGTETRRLAVPKAIAGRFAAAKDGGYKAVQLLKDQARNGVYVRPGEDAPDGYAFAPSVFDKEGTYHGQEDTARAWNENMKAGRGDSIQELPKTLANLAIAQRYSMSLAHGVWGATTHLANNLGRALGFGTKDWTERFQALKNLGFVDSMTRANELREHIESGGKMHPGLADVADRVMATNPGTHFQSVLDKPRWADAVNEFKHDNIVGGVGKSVMAIAKAIKDGIYHGALDNFDLSLRRDVAERQIRQGVSAEEGTAEISRAGGSLSAVLGRHVNSPEFRNANLTAIGRILAPAYQLKVGAIKTVGSVLTNPNARALVAGGVMLHTLANAAMQLALTKYNTGTAITPNATDLLLGARTGLQNQAGKDQRVSIPTPMAYMIRQFFSGGKKAAEELVGSINPGITGAVEVGKNKDFYGNQVRPDDASYIGNFFRGLAHISKGAVPGSITSPMDQGLNDTRGPLNRSIQSVTGIHTGHPETSSAMEIAEEALDANQTKGRNLKEQALYNAKQGWANRIREASGDPEKTHAIEEEMSKNPAMGDKEIDSVFTRASRKQGLASIVLDSKMSPDTLSRMWDAATDEEKETMRPGMLERLDRAKPDNDELQSAWGALEKKIGVRK